MATTHSQAAATAAAPTPTTAAAAGPVGELDLETRLALTDAGMTVRLQDALLRLGVDAAAPETDARLEDAGTEALTAYVARAQPTPAFTYRTPVAALLDRAARRLEADGWCRDATRDASGARCLYGAIHAEASAAGEEDDALALLLEAIRRRDPRAQTIPAHNADLAGAAAAVQLLTQAARLADARGQ
ncbi:hypothetical protein SAMN06297387_13140 [Streptomyces zhaozhouensis]|uniref:Uncharacterized protein n=1 Tax=Streptomyces zhaozhouensis TaxID=1300267 RepID=A0A286E9C9_9ACTN|nr:hypothetical protein [Streptomyces zhaozhouensis]SOD67507.1 hypothetical protein SAMN06297387_13140 [Streptomyces zhaozhouensis]